ncbi:MAG: AsmA family protein [Bryobacteraceae bacterium]|nr:AsmA family protein [Bryobacteraceae bacterium]MDW8379526.1 AsmA-like C-terminal region-containing protein [Bryobacterales bacterium]
MARALKVVGGAAAALLLAGGVFFLLVDPNQFRGTIQSQLEKLLQRRVSLGAMKLRIFPLSIAVEDVSIASSKTLAETRPLLTAKQVLVRVDLLALLKKQVQIESLHVVEPVLELVKLPSGAWNFSQEKEQTRPPGPTAQIRLADLKLINGRVGITDLAARKPREEYQGIDVELSHFAFNQPFRAELTMHLPQKIDLQTKLEASYIDDREELLVHQAGIRLGGLAIVASGRLLAGSTPATLDFKLNTKNSSIRELAAVAAAFGTAFSPDMKVEGKLDAELTVAGEVSRPVLNGQIGLKQMVISRRGWKQPVRIPLVEMRLQPEAISAPSFAIESGNTRLQAQAKISDYRAGNALLEAALRTTNADLGELLNVATAYGFRPAGGVKAQGEVSIDFRMRARYKTSAPWDYSGTARLRNSSLLVPELEQPLKISQADVRFEEEGAVIENLMCSLGSSRLQGSLSVRNFSSPDLRFQAEIDQVKLEELSRLWKASSSQPEAPAENPTIQRAWTARGALSLGKLAYESLVLHRLRSEVIWEGERLLLDPVTAELFGGQQTGTIRVDLGSKPWKYSLQVKMNQVDASQLLASATPLRHVLTGSFAGEADLSFSPKPGEFLTQSMNGTLQIRLADGKLLGVNILNEMARLANLLGYRKHPELVTNFLKFASSMRIENGVAHCDSLLMEFDGGTLGGSGILNLVDQSLQLKLTTVLAKAISDQFSSNKIGGLLTSALQNAKGELVIPSVVSGTAPKPVFAPDAKEIARMRAEGVLPVGKDPATAVGNVGSAIEAGRRKNVQGVFDAIAGRKRQETASDASNSSSSPAPVPSGDRPAGSLPATTEASEAPPPGPAPEAGQTAPPEKKKGLGESLLELFRKKK